MRDFLALAVIFCLLPAFGAAQVTVNPAALTQLAGISAPPPPVFAAPAPAPPPVHHFTHRRHFVMAVDHPPPALSAPPPPKLIPAVTRLAPPPAAPHKPVAPASLVFAPGSSTLPAGAASALKPYCGSSGVIGINAHAPGDPSDPSIAMRLSLQRALAVRDALIACGVPSQNILPRALGSVPGQNEDETILGTIK